MKRPVLIIGAAVALLMLPGVAVSLQAQDLVAGPDQIGFRLSLEGENFTRAVNVFLLITVLSLVPSFIMMMTSFTRIIVVLSFLRQALGAQQVPSGRIISGLALFLTFFIMQPVWEEVYEGAVVPYSQGAITQSEALDRAETPIKNFMLRQTRESSLRAFMEMAGQDPVAEKGDLSMRVVIPAFMVSELQTAFQMGFLIYLPFLIIDAVVATFLMSMGMMMLPPMMVSLPFKLLLFVMVNAWDLVVKAVVRGFVA